MIPYKPIVRVSPYLHLRCNWRWRWAGKFWGQKVKGQDQDQIFSNKLFGRLILQTAYGNFINFATCVQLGTKVNWLDLRSESQRSRSWWARSRWDQPWSKSLVNKCTLPAKA